MATWGDVSVLWADPTITWNGNVYVPPPPPPPPGPPEPTPEREPVRLARWQFVLDTLGEQIELATARNRKIVARLTSPSEASFALDGRHETAAEVVELTSDVLVYRDGEPLYRGRVGATADDVGEAHAVLISTGDYRALLNRRILYSPVPTFTDVDQAEIAWNLIEDTQARTGGNLGITPGVGFTAGVGSTGVLRTRNAYEAGKSIGEAIQQLSEVIDGFDWDITPTLDLDVHYPTRGADNGVVLDYGGIVTSVRRQVDPSTYANAIRVNGDEALTVEEREAVDLAARDEGRWDAQHGYTTITAQGTLSDRADWQIDQDQVLTPTYTVSLKPGSWGGPDHIWLGDTAQLVVFSGRLTVNTSLRVYEVDVTINDEGVEYVQLALGGARPDFRRRLSDQVLRLDQLERR